MSQVEEHKEVGVATEMIQGEERGQNKDRGQSSSTGECVPDNKEDHDPVTKRELCSISPEKPKSHSASAHRTSEEIEPSAPKRLRVEEVRSRSVRLCWDTPTEMEGVSYTYSITYTCDGEEPKEQTTGSNSSSADLCDLKPGVEYSFSICTVLHNGSRSRACSAQAHTQTSLEELVFDLGLENNLKKRLSLTALLEITQNVMPDEPTTSLKSLPWCFLRKLMMMNTTARSVRCSVPEDVDSLPDDDSFDEGEEVNPLDLITALFLCSDGFLQQEMALKMSMCQFSVPLLLPNCDTQELTLMLWALRDIVKKFRPHSLQESKGFVEQSIVLTQLPLISFVRLGNSSSSKSHILNQILSSSQQNQNTFIHWNMPGGNIPRRISEGLVEISWYLPCGNGNMDIFPEPVAVANLRGDINAFDTQFSFLCKISAAVFVFCDDLGSNTDILKAQNISSRLYIVGHSADRNVNRGELQNHADQLQLQRDHILKKGRNMNESEFVKKLQMVVKKVIKGNCVKMSVEKMSAIAHELEIAVDEDDDRCQNAKKNADLITAGISDIPEYKESKLPLQGEIWKELAKLEKEECRLRHAGDTNIEKYRSELSKQKQRLREQHRAHDISDAMSSFISALSGPREERFYFLKWMKINLDHLSLRHLSDLQERFKELRLNSLQNKENIAKLDRQIASSSLGVEHFLREMGQLYEVACSLPENDPYRQQMQNLPRHCAQLLLDGFPVELIDGDASNIPLQWVNDVLTELHSLTQSKNRIRVITVLGVQSSGKSTLLNAMFGVQFAVSSGKCTRGAFMLLIRVQEDFREQLGCDFIMVIDTEGLKSPELAQLADSYEHDNELATLVVGLSDIAIINIAMENNTEMKDVLQIVVHAFLRMKEVGKNPCCMFVHQNVADISAHGKNVRDRKLLLEQLNKMTQVAARMEKRVETKKFTDVMDYDPERDTWYIPGLWHGTPPMAPVNAGYSEKVSEFKRSMIEALIKLKLERAPHTLPEFLGWTSSLWKAVKYENFIFSFQNSLVADAYTKLCSEYNSWEWDFRKHMYTWLTEAETRVSNFGTITKSVSDLDELKADLKTQAFKQLQSEGEKILQNLTGYFKRQDGHAYLVVKYKEEFMNSAKALRTETGMSVIMKLEAAVEIKKGMTEVESIKKNHKSTIEQQVLKLLDSCRRAKMQMSEQQLELEFEKMWEETMQKLSFTGLPRQNVDQQIYSLLRSNLETKGGSVHEMLHKASNLKECGTKPIDMSEGQYTEVKMHFGFFKHEQMKKTEEMSDSIIEQCRQLITDKVRTKTDFHKTYIMELLGRIDEHLEKHRDLEVSDEFKASLKIHICGHAAQEFQKMHDAFITDNDPRRCLEKFKHQYCADFKDVFQEKDQCQRKAEEFTTQCLKPAVREYINKSLGPEIMDEVLAGSKAKDFSSRFFFQFSILQKLHLGDKFEKFVRYIKSYEDFVKEWILEKLEEHFSINSNKISHIYEKCMMHIIKKIKDAVQNIQNTVGRSEEDMNIQIFIQEICTNLSESLVIPKDALDAVMLLNKAKTEQVSHWLLSSIDEMEQSLRAEFQSDDLGTRLTTLPFKPQDELFRRLFGCGKQCPFCKAPCEAGGDSHTEHFTSIHRPEGLGKYRWTHSQKLVPDICSSLVASEIKFSNHETNGEYHPYKDYIKFYPDWRIQPDTSIQASVYWKFVFAKFNTQFAEQYKAEPADLPSDWSQITKEEALQSLEKAFRMKTQEEGKEEVFSPQN